MPKWSEGFRDTVLRETGLRAFTYVTAVTRLSGDRSEWEQLSRFRKAMGGNPIRLLPLSEMVAYVLPRLTRTPAGSDLGRTLQLLKASGVLGGPAGGGSKDFFSAWALSSPLLHDFRG